MANDDAGPVWRMQSDTSQSPHVKFSNNPNERRVKSANWVEVWTRKRDGEGDSWTNMNL